MSDELTKLANEIMDELRAHGVDGTENQGLHSWRCKYPDRYGPCLCFETLVSDLTKRLAARQPSPSARDVALKCLAIARTYRGVQEAAPCIEEQIQAFADTLGNESVAQEQAEAHPPCTGASPPAATDLAPTQIDADLAKHKARYGAADPAPEARELKVEAFAALLEMIGDLSDAHDAIKLRGAAQLLRDLQQALARVQERLNVLNWLEACAKKTGIEVTFGADGNMQVTHGTFQKDLERAEAELAKVREERLDYEFLLRMWPLEITRLCHSSHEGPTDSEVHGAVRAARLASAPSAKEGSRASRARRVSHEASGD